MWIDLDQHLDDLVERGSPDAIGVRIAQHTFPDLRAFKDPDGVTRCCSLEATSYCDRLEIKHDTEGRMYVMTFTVDQDVRIYSEPPVQFVGRYNEKGFGNIEEEGWKERLEQGAWHEDTIKKVKDYFAKHRPSDF